MSKKLLLLLIAVFAVFGLASCETDVELTAITFSGVADISVDNGSTFNVLDGVVALGNDEVDYSDQITIVTTSQAVNTTTGALDTLQAGVHFVRYEVRVGELVAQQSRNITVKAPVAVEGELVVNGDMSAGIGGWNDPAVVYFNHENDGSSISLSSDNGTLKVEVISGGESFSPRFGQMNIAFENGKTYEVTFEAKSDVAKEIGIQVGELLTSAPWYTDFLPKAEDVIFKVITTEWATHSFKFTMTQDNDRGGILFGLGGDEVNATMHFDNINIKESTPDPDTTGPVISGAVDIEIKIGSTFNPLSGVQALDVTDGDVTANLVAVIKDGEGDIVSAVDTSAPGTFTVTYTVSDSLNNKSELVITVTVVDEIPNPDWIGYGTTVYNKAKVTYTGITANWWEKNVQLVLDSFDGEKDIATFPFKGVTGQKYLFKIEANSNTFVEMPVTATGEMQDVILDLSGLTEAQRDELKLAIVFAQDLDASGTFELYGVKESTVTTDWVGYGMNVVLSTTMSYPAPDPNAWWNNNSQLVILEFDGTKDTVEFEFIGTAGVTYLFKIEGGGRNVEADVVATGNLQKHTLDLSAMTEVQRDGLNLLIIFDKNSTSGSLLELFAVNYLLLEEPSFIGYGMTVVRKAYVSYSGITANWWEKNVQLPITEFDGTKNTATFGFKGISGQTYLFKVEGGGKFVETPFVADGTLQEIVLNLSTLNEVERNGLILAIVFAQDLDAAGTMELYSIKEAVIGSDWIGYGMSVLVVDALTFPAPNPSAWWEKNAQLKVNDFNGERNTVEFDFVGTTGVTYLFKIEGNGQALELEVVATGQLQTHILDLSGMTEAQRDGLNLIIIFDKNSSEGSTLELYSIEYVTKVNYTNTTVFTNAELPKGTSYPDGTFTDANGLVWTFVEARDAGDFGFGENKDGIMLRRADEPSSLQVTLTSGLDDLSIEFKKAFTGGTPRTYEIHITNNGTTETYTIPAFGEGTGPNDTIGTFTLSNLGLTGEVTVKIVAVGSNGNQQAVFNNFKWNANPTT